LTSASSSSQQTRAASNRVAASGDYYKLLGVPYSATRADITRAYRGAMKQVHPDRRNPEEREEAEAQARLLNLAYSTLVNSQTRRAYDNSLKAQVVQDQIMSQYFGGFGMPGSADPFGEKLKREQSEFERQDQKRGDRHAMASIVVVFAGVTIAILLLLLLWAALSALVTAAS
jgi:DnaJ-class molecular chaperone